MPSDGESLDDRAAMTVTELREALQVLETQGHGGLRCVVRVDFKDRDWLDEAEPEVLTIGKGWEERDYPVGSSVVMLR